MPNKPKESLDLSSDEIKELLEKHADFVEEVTALGCIAELGDILGFPPEMMDIAKARRSELRAQATDEQLTSLKYKPIDMKLLSEDKLEQVIIELMQSTQSAEGNAEELKRRNLLSTILNSECFISKIVNSAVSECTEDNPEISDLTDEKLEDMKLHTLESLMRRIAYLATGDDNADIFDPEVVRRVIAMSEDPNFDDKFLSILAERNDPDALEIIMENLDGDPTKIPQNVRDAIAKLSIAKA